MRFGGFFHGFSFGAGFELMRRVIVPAILVATPLMLWWWLGPEKPSCDSARQLAAKCAIAQATGRIRAERGEIRRAAVLHLENDPTDFVTLALREQLKEGGMLDLDGTPSMEKIRNLLNLRNAGMFDAGKAVAYGKDNGLDAVIIGRLDEFETVDGKAVLKGQLKFIRVANGEVVDIPLSDSAAGGGIAEEIKKTMEGDLAGGIPVELFQILKDDAMKVLHSICQQIWKTQQWPQDWKRSVFIPIPKKGNAKECSNYCTIALISHTSKVMLKLPHNCTYLKRWLRCRRYR